MDPTPRAKVIPLRKEFKYYKARQPAPNLSQVLHPKEGSEDHFKRLPVSEVALDEAERASLGLLPASDWRLWSCRSVPGLLLLENPFTSEGQLEWSHRCLRDYARSPPNRTNLDIQAEELKRAAEAKRPKSEKGGGENSFYWFREAQLDPRLLGKLRWATLGYHHDWNTKVYSESSVSAFPAELSRLSEVLALASGFPSFRSEAAIVNYYTLDSTLCGHTDHSEQNMQAPLISVSLGQSAIFLMGGEPEDYEVGSPPATALFLHSGDVVVMSGGARGRYHAVPKIVKTGNNPLRITRSELNPEEKFSLSYLDSHRINMNIRQVF